MTPQELKNSILQLAIQGKLVPQRAEEGNAEDLYKLIQSEKQKLIKEGKIKKEKSLPSITDEEKPFEIPSNWKWVRLGEVLIIARGGSPRPIKSFITNNPNGINWIKIGDADKNGKYINRTNEKIIPEGLSKTRFVKKGDFLLSNSMSFGHPYILNIDGCIHDGWLVLSPIVEIFNKDFLYYLLSSSMVYNQFCRRVSGAVVNNLNSEKVATTLIPLPPLAEQKRIVAKIEELLPYVERYETAYNKLQQLNKRFPDDLQKSVLQLAIQGRLVPQCPEEGNAEELYKQIQAEKQKLIKEGKIKKEKPLPPITDDEKPFEIPASWKWVRLGEIGFTQTGNTPSKTYVEYFGTDIPFINPGDITNNIINYSNKGLSTKGKSVARTCDKNTILQVCIGGSIGKSAIVDREVTFNQQINSIYPILVYHNYLHKVISSAFFISIMKEKAGGTATPIINRTTWNTLLVSLPPLAEQKRIVTKIEEILPMCNKMK